jgi:hypothetical protein
MNRGITWGLSRLNARRKQLYGLKDRVVVALEMLTHIPNGLWSLPLLMLHLVLKVMELQK